MIKRILVDGQNLLRHGDGIIKLGNLKILRSWAKENDAKIIVVLPSSRKYKEKIPSTNDICFVNSRVYDDSALIQLANNHNHPILSNDKFREYRKKYPEYDFNSQVFAFDIVLGVLVTELTDYCRIIQTCEKNIAAAIDYS